MHMISKKDLKSAEMDTLTTSRSSDDSHNSHWRSADAWRGHSLRQRIGYILDKRKSSRYASQSYRSERLCDETWILIRMDQQSKTTSHCKRCSYTVQDRELRSYRGSWLSTSFLPPAFPLQHPWHLQGRKLIILRLPQARLPSPTMTVSSDSETGAREDLSGIDSIPVLVSSEHVERKERRDPLTKPTKNPKPNKKRRPRIRTERPILFRSPESCKNSEKISWMRSSWTQRLTRQFFSWTIFMEDPVVPSWAKSVRSSFGRTVMGKAVWENPIEVRLGEGFQLGMLIRTPWKRVVLICVCGWHQIGWKETKHWSDVESTQQGSWFGRTNIFPWSCIPGVYSKTMWDEHRYCWQLKNHAWITNFRGWNWKFTILGKSSNLFNGSYDMEGHAKKCVERYCELANRTTQQLYKVSTPCIDDHHFKEEEMTSVG